MVKLAHRPNIRIRTLSELSDKHEEGLAGRRTLVSNAEMMLGQWNVLDALCRC